MLPVGVRNWITVDADAEPAPRAETASAATIGRENTRRRLRRDGDGALRLPGPRRRSA